MIGPQTHKRHIWGRIWWPLALWSMLLWVGVGVMLLAMITHGNMWFGGGALNVGP